MLQQDDNMQLINLLISYVNEACYSLKYTVSVLLQINVQSGHYVLSTNRAAFKLP